jgi:hypothetical protein
VADIALFHPFSDPGFRLFVLVVVCSDAPLAFLSMIKRGREVGLVLVGSPEKPRGDSLTCR